MSNQLTEQDFQRIAEQLQIEIAALKAVQQVETGGRGGFFEPGKPAILFEGHIFWSQLKKKGVNPEDHLKGNENVLYPKWEKKHYLGGIREYERLEKVRMINVEAANASASWGMFQIMGFNYAACGCKSMEEFVQAMCESEVRQLELFANFIRLNKMDMSLKDLDWAGFAKRYNGPLYAENKYDAKLAAAYQKFK